MKRHYGKSRAPTASVIPVMVFQL